ncbi:MAG: hypothetical protein M3536_12445 [Actinomycetota bacterium]|nr:hypothetical protein [Actinomycetota bacterium]
MARPKFKFRMAGFEEIRRGPEAVALLSRIVNDTASAAGDGYVGRVDQAPGKKTLGRAVGRVVTGNIEAMLDNRRNNTLVRTFDRLGG